MEGKGQTSIPSAPSPPLLDPMSISFGTITRTDFLSGTHLVEIGTKGTNSDQMSSIPRLPSTPPSVPVPISSGSMGTEYKRRKKHVITDPNRADSRTYYEGFIIHKGKDHEKHRKDVCFVVRDTFDEAKRILDLSGLISHPWVMKASAFFFDYLLQKYLVCFDRFESLENAKKENSLAKQLNDPKLNATVPGNPGTFVQEEIKGLAEGIYCMHQNHVSSSNLEWSYGYVWCPVTSHVKIMLVDTLLEEGNTPGEIIEGHLMQFSKGLKKYFLKARKDPSSHIIWPKREQFLNCFTESEVPIEKRLKMVINHTFLISNIQDILQFIYMLYHALNSGLPYRGHKLTMFKSRLNNRTLGKIRRIRNKFGHELKNEKDVRRHHEEIEGRDPLLFGEIYRVYEKSI